MKSTTLLLLLLSIVSFCFGGESMHRPRGERNKTAGRSTPVPKTTSGTNNTHMKTQINRQQKQQGQPLNISKTSYISTRSATTKTPSDPKFPSSWYFNGEVAPSINIDCLWSENFTGKGSKVLVLDDSFDFTNPELLNKEYADASWNYMTNCRDVSPTTSSQWHGTPVAGIIAGTHNNSICGVGVAPNALIAGRVVIFDDTTVDILIKGLSENLNDIDIISNSWGISTCDLEASNGSSTTTYCNLVEDVGLETAVKEFATAGRNGKGGVVLFAAGDTGAQSTSDTNLNPAARIPYSITVGAVDSNLAPATTSPRGKSLFITAPGSDSGTDIGVIGPTSKYSNGTITHGCSENLVGSGASTPLVAGVVALMYEAKSDLTSDEVRQILMHTARKIDKADSSWTTNSAGVSHSTRYGFGYIDAAGAIEMTKKWTSCGSYKEQTTGVQTSLSSYYNDCLVNGNIQLPAGSTVNIPFFMKTLDSVIIDSLSVTIDNIANSSVEVALREDKRYVSTSSIKKRSLARTRANNGTTSTQQMPFSTIINTKSNPSLSDQCSGTVTLTTYQYAGMSSNGEWTMSIKNNGTTTLSIPLSSLTLTARGYPSVLDISTPEITYQNGAIQSIKITPSLNDPGTASQDFGRGMRVYIWVDGTNPIPATDSSGNPLVVSILGGDIVIPWKQSYGSLLSGLSSTQTKNLRILLVDADEEYSPFTFNTCHTVISPVVVVNISDTPSTGEEEVLEEEESLPPTTVPEEETVCEEVEEELEDTTVVCEEEEEEEIENIPLIPILPPDEEESSDGFDFKRISPAKLASLLSAVLLAMAI